MRKKRHRNNIDRWSRKRTYRKRRRRGLLVMLGLIILVFVALLYYLGVHSTSQPDVGVVERVEDPTVAEAPEPVPEDTTSEKQSSDEGATDEEEEVTPPPPDDPTLLLSVPKLGVYGAVVIDGEAGLEIGAQHVYGYPWEKEDNTYIAGHRIGFPGTGSDHIFYNLPLMARGDEIILTDANGREYTYRVSEVFAVSPSDSWVMDPIEGRDVISLQTCTENPNDWWTMGPSLFGGGPESGRLVVRADKV